MTEPHGFDKSQGLLFNTVRHVLSRCPDADPHTTAQIICQVYQKATGLNKAGDQLASSVATGGRDLYRLGYMPGTSGNISLRLPDGNILITPSGVNKGRMDREDLIIIDSEGNLIEGRGKPSSEYKMHTACYDLRPDVGAVVHCHPPYCTAMASCGVSLEDPVLPEGILVLGPVPLVEYSTPSTREVSDNLIPFLKDRNVFLLANHGALCLGADLNQALHRMETLEFTARVVTIARTLGRERNLTPAQHSRLLKVWKDSTA